MKNEIFHQTDTSTAKGLRTAMAPTTTCFSGLHYPQAWFPLAGYDLRAPVPWSVMPGG